MSHDKSELSCSYWDMPKASESSTGLEPPSKALCVTKLDRFVIAGPRFFNDDYMLGDSHPVRVHPSISGFRRVADTFVRRQGKIQTYRRVRSLRNPATGTQFFLQYDRAHGFLYPFRGTIVGADSTGIPWGDLQSIGDAYGDFSVRMIELSFDFAPGSGVDEEYVRKHALFGKARPACTGKFRDRLRYGARGGRKLVRCYAKTSVDAYRVELELHAPFFGVPDSEWLIHTTSLRPADFRFVFVRWAKLDAYLATRGNSGSRVSAAARSEANSVYGLLAYLRSAAVPNPHRFLRTAAKDELVRSAFTTWRNSLDPKIRRRKEHSNDEED